MGYFDMIDSSDVYVIFDHVQFIRKSWHRRNRIKTHNGELMLSVPVKNTHQDTPICKIEITNPITLSKHWKTISLAYGKSRYFNDYKEYFLDVYSHKYVLLRDLNVALIKAICKILGIKKNFINSSNIIHGKEEKNLCRTGKVINLCKKIGISYLNDAKGASDLLDPTMFDKENIDIRFQNFQHPPYNQLHGGFIEYMSVIDLIFNEGVKSLDIIRSGRRYNRFD